MAALLRKVLGVKSSPAAQQRLSFETLGTDVLILIFEEVCELHLSNFESRTHRTFLALQLRPRVFSSISAFIAKAHRHCHIVSISLDSTKREPFKSF